MRFAYLQQVNIHGMATPTILMQKYAWCPWYSRKLLTFPSGLDNQLPRLPPKITLHIAGLYITTVRFSHVTNVECYAI